jgi:hypothetical protein
MITGQDRLSPSNCEMGALFGPQRRPDGPICKFDWRPDGPLALSFGGAFRLSGARLPESGPPAETPFLCILPEFSASLLHNI